MQKVLPMSYYYISYQRQRRAYTAVKRLLDIVLSLVMLVALLPLELVIAVIAAADTKGTPIFVQQRMGRYNKPFKMLKFRTMSVDAPANVATHKLSDAESYISRVGGLLRKLSLDELPQLWNILKGDMSFIGPRPVVLTETALLKRRRELGADRVRPGITGLAQVKGRDDVPIRHKARYDAFYADHRSARLDGWILLRTVRFVITGAGIREGAPAAPHAEHRHKSRSKY